MERFRIVALGVFALVAVAAAQRGPTTSTQPALTETKKIEALIKYVATLEGAVFIRNGSNHTPANAAQHMRSKWDASRNQIRTARQFIEQAASKSSLTGEEYRVRLKDGRTVSSESLLTAELDRLVASP